jgi:hypothetical protein
MQKVLVMAVLSILAAGCGEVKKGADKPLESPLVDTWLACGQFVAAPADGSEVALTYDAAGEIVPGGYFERDTLFNRAPEQGPTDKGFYSIKPTTGALVHLRAEDVSDTCPTDGTAIIDGYRAIEKNISLTPAPNADNWICHIQGDKPVVVKTFKVDPATPAYIYVETEAIEGCGSDERKGYVPVAGAVFGKFYFGKPTAGMELVKGIQSRQKAKKEADAKAAALEALRKSREPKPQ